MASVEGVGHIAPPDELIFLDPELADRAGSAGRERAMKQEYQQATTWKRGMWTRAKTMVVGCIAECAVYQMLRDLSRCRYQVSWDDAFIRSGGDSGADVFAHGLGLEVKGIGRLTGQNLIRKDHYERLRKRTPYGIAFAHLAHGVLDKITDDGEIVAPRGEVCVAVRGWLKWKRVAECEVVASSRHNSDWRNYLIPPASLSHLSEFLEIAEARAALC